MKRSVVIFFFFQAEDGIRDGRVTGVQTCALPICYGEYNDVVDNISMVLGGFDPVSKKYVGAEAVIKAQIAQVQADKKMSPKDKKDALADLNQALKAPEPPIENKGNIDLVGKYYDKLSAIMGDDQN